MAQTGYTPISIYYSATATNTPTAGNLVAGELAINTADGILYYKDSSGVVQSIASKAGNSGSFTNLAYTGTLTGGTGVVNLGSGQFYKDASGNVGIGTTTPDIFTSGNRVLGLYTGSGVAQMQISGSTAARIDFGLGTTRYGVLYQDSTNFMQLGTITSLPLVFNTANTERMRINAGAPILCLAGGNTSATGTGIAFPATQSASSDANTLDDYEEGTFTPTWLGSTTNPTVSGMQTLAYTKIGRLVTITGDMFATSVSGGSGNLSIGNLPFASSTGSTSGYGGVGLGPTSAWNSTGAPTRGVVTPNTTVCQLFINSSSDARSNAITACTVASSSLQAYSEIYLCFSYFTS